MPGRPGPPTGISGPAFAEITSASLRAEHTEKKVKALRP
jgi:hypothetical protein